MEPPRRFVSLAEPFDVAAARLTLFAYLDAAHARNAIGLRFTDQSGAGGPQAAGLSHVVEELTWLGIAVAGDPLTTASRAGLYHDYIGRLLAADRAHVVGTSTLLRVPAGETVIDDAVKGRVVFANAVLGDVVLVDSDGTVTATLADALDAVLLDMSPLVRDDRQLEQSARGQLILNALGLPAPHYAHVGALLPDTPGAALPSIAQLRRAGYLPAPVVEHLTLLGAAPLGDGEALDWPERIAAFSIDGLHASPAHFNQARLRALNSRVLRALPPDQLAELVAAAMQRAGLLEDPIPDPAHRWIDTFLRAYGTQFATLGEATALAAELRAEAVVVPALELERLRNRQVVFYLDAVGQYVDAQPELRDLPLEHDLPVIAHEFGIAHDDAFAALRMALTGKHDGAPLTLLFPLLGHDRILIRIGAISSHLLHGRGLEPVRYGPGGVPFSTIGASRPPAD